jgi:hypothetical protein
LIRKPDLLTSRTWFADRRVAAVFQQCGRSSSARVPPPTSEAITRCLLQHRDLLVGDAICGFNRVTAALTPTRITPAGSPTPPADAQENTLYTYDNNGNLITARTRSPIKPATSSTR